MRMIADINEQVLQKKLLAIIGGFAISLSGIFLLNQNVFGQSLPWHGKERHVHYLPQGNDFVKVQGSRRFNRALYGTNTGFRVETGDLPEFALYMPGMGGNLSFSLQKGTQYKALIKADSIRTIYRPGSMIYEIRDELLGKGLLTLTVLAMHDREGMIIKADWKNIPSDIVLNWVYGGATGKKFSRDGDIGADPESVFYLKPENCTDNIFTKTGNSFQLLYGFKKPLTDDERYEVQHLPVAQSTDNSNASTARIMQGIFPPTSVLQVREFENRNDADFNAKQIDPVKIPVMAGALKAISNAPHYFLFQNGTGTKMPAYASVAPLFQQAEASRKKLASRIKLVTPDSLINPLAAALSVAADAIYEDPSFLHGSVAWRMRLPAWRGAYVADPLGWHDRARSHFTSYALSQVQTPLTGPVVADTALHLARQQEKMGNSMFSNGYICRNPNGDMRPHHYDMNLVFVDQLLTHFNWTGDTALVRQMWPLITSHLAWEKRNFDADGDFLYDAYCCIWASDALQYSGGGVTHSSAYNFRANQSAAQLAKILGVNGSIYEKEAKGIQQALQQNLWLKNKGWFGENKDLLGEKLVHEAPGIWTIYHAMESGVANPFESHQMMQYVNNHIPKIPMQATGLNEKGLYAIPTTNWQPYTWSVNNVALAEILHTSLAYWQAGQQSNAYALWRSSLIESMYLSASPGGFEQLSFYDAIRGELYRDFADPIGMAARSLVEGLFGIKPQLLQHKLLIQTGFPADWKHASIKAPDIDFSFRKSGNISKYSIQTYWKTKTALHLQIPAQSAIVTSVTINGKKANYSWVADAIGNPKIEITSPAAAKYEVVVTWGNTPVHEIESGEQWVVGQSYQFQSGDATFLNVFDPQQCLLNPGINAGGKGLSFAVNQNPGHHTVFVQQQQGNCKWWQAMDVEIVPALTFQLKSTTENTNRTFEIFNETEKDIKGSLFLNQQNVSGIGTPITIISGKNIRIKMPPAFITNGTNQLHFKTTNGAVYKHEWQEWEAPLTAHAKFETVALAGVFNQKITQIIEQKYMSPRPASPTLMLPWQGIGNWCYPLTTASINDAGLRTAAAKNSGVFKTPLGIPFATPADTNQANILFTSKWDNYPGEATVPLSGKASKVYLLMAGTTNHMQSRMVNGYVLVTYADGSVDSLALRNPENWWPIEQDYLEDGYAFTTDAPKPWRVILKTGEVTRNFNDFSSIKGFSNRAIDGGAATILDLPLQKNKELRSLTVKTLVNEVIIGLMAATLVRD